jgi:hypothetical protein
MKTIHRPTIEELQATVRSLAEAVADTDTGDECWERYLRWMSQFHNYSAQNVLVIKQQHPSATACKGFQGWKTAGRVVKAGQKAIYIYAPIKGSRLVELDCLTGEATYRDWLRFRAVAVFDLDQTVAIGGSKVDWSPPNYKVNLDNAEPLHSALISYAQRLGITCCTDPLYGSTNGFYSPEKKRITINSHLPLGVATNTLSHEIIHSLLIDKHSRDDAPRSVVEAETEAASAVLLMALGYPQVRTNSAAYIRSWAGDPSVIVRSLNDIAGAANQVLCGVLGHLPQAPIETTSRNYDIAAMEVGNERDDC